MWNTLLIHGGRLAAHYLKGFESALGWGMAGLTGLFVAWYGWRVITWKPRD